MANNLFLYFIVFIGIFLSSIAGLYSISGLVIVFKGNVIATTLMAIALEISKVCVSIYIHVFWKKANKLLLVYLTFALLVLMMITSAGVYSYLSKSYMTSTDTDVIYEKIKLTESQIEIEKEKIRNKQEEVKSLRNYPMEKRDNAYYWKINGINAKITEYTNTIEKLTDGITPLRNKVLEINTEIGPLKYISLLLYQSEGKAAIDKSVQIFIGIVVVVFDPLAILLIFSGIHGLHKRKIELEKIQQEIDEKKEKEKERRQQLKLEKDAKNELILKEKIERIKEKKERIKLEREKSKKQKDFVFEDEKNENQIEKLNSLEKKITKTIVSQMKENAKELAEIKEVINVINPKIEDEQLPSIPPPPPIAEEALEKEILMEKQILEEDIKKDDNKKILKIKTKNEKPKKEKIILNEKEIIPPLIKNRPKKIKKEQKIKTEEDILLEKKIKDQLLDKEKAIDFLYNGERQEEYLIKYEKKRKKK